MCGFRDSELQKKKKKKEIPEQLAEKAQNNLLNDLISKWPKIKESCWQNLYKNTLDVPKKR